MPPTARAVVRRRNWRWSPGNEHTPRGWVCLPGPGTAVAEFDTLDAAEADWGKREADVRRKINPFECGPLPMVSSLPDPILRDFLMDTGIEPPAPGVEWAAWWIANREQLSDEQQARLWQATDKVRFFESTEEAAGPEVHVVVDVLWEERGVIHVADWDGGELIRACRNLARAGEIARGRSQQSRLTMAGHRGVDGVTFANCRPCNVPDPFNPGSTRLMSLPQAPFSEVVTIPFDERGDGLVLRNERVNVVVRHDYAPSPYGFRPARFEPGVPVKAFADWGEAEGYALDLERITRARFNPFCLGTTPGAVSLHGDSNRLAELGRAAGLPVPKDSGWECWWTDHVAALPIPKRDKFWDQLAVRFYSVMSVAFEG